MIDHILTLLRFSQVFLLVIDKSSKISFYFTVLPLGLAINLREENNKIPLQDFKKVI